MSGSKKKYVGLNPIPPEFAKAHPPLALVVEEDCIGCDRCIPLCFFDALVMVDRPEHKYKRVALVDPDNCTGCGLCFEACPTDAFVWVPDYANGRGVTRNEANLEDRDL
jgi:H+/Na+-translocating ferredoxin:NAD+ oxidoreductase subunit B